MKNIFDLYSSYRNRKAFEQARQIAVLSELNLQSNKNAYNPPSYPFFEKKVQDYIDHIEIYLPTTKKVHINFGDSITDLARRFLPDIDGIYSLSGSWSNHVYDMIRALTPVIYQEGIDVGKVSIGTLIGNPLLVYSNYDEALADAIKTLNLCRETFENAQMVVYGIPPVFNLWATEHSIELDLTYQKWCDWNNAKFISLRDHFGSGLLKIFPTMKYSSDGIHLSPQAAIKLNALLRDAR